MKKPTKEHQPTYDDVQAVLMRTTSLRDAVLACSKNGHSATVQIILLWIAGELREIERLALTARSGPNEVEELRKEGHDV